MSRPAAAPALALGAGAAAPVAALQSAADEARSEATTFRPALVVLTRARVVGDRLLLLVDEAADYPAARAERASRRLSPHGSHSSHSAPGAGAAPPK